MDLNAVAVKLAELINAVGNELKNPLFGLIGLIKSLSAFDGIDWVAFKAEVLALDDAGRAALEQAFENAVNLPSEVATSNVIKAAEDMLQAVDLAYAASGLYAQAMDLEQKVKALFGI